VLTPIEIPSSVDAWPVPTEVETLIHDSLERIERFQDNWERTRIEQFVAADYRHVYQALAWINQTQLRIGDAFLEWGCGFAVVTCLARRLGFSAVGIEAEDELIIEGRITAEIDHSAVTLVSGNFLPPGAEDLADDPTLPSVGHTASCGYASLDADLRDFAIVYGYPWPGEDSFHAAVFDRYAARGGMLLMFRGPNDLRLFRRTG